MLTPDLYLQSVRDIDLDALSARGVDTLLVDLDNTLSPRNSDAMPTPHGSGPNVSLAAASPSASCRTAGTRASPGGRGTRVPGGGQGRQAAALRLPACASDACVDARTLPPWATSCSPMWSAVSSWGS